MEDLNYLLKREQEEIMRAKASICFAARTAHEGLAQGYAKRIRDHRLPYRSLVTDERSAFDPAPYGGGGTRS
ncbi:hypothetical protein ACFSUK_17605 [Sphingobium scionense]|jgi:hypothetical protein|uniref:Uncharacterized protein n=1 Tax=Sphingobium scionense TaxID=1404341 RepID=A0A7W6LSF9_9SPHN|nr:hypothetical protein [Sphingobium scionense]MBB4149511.1 hypothetical protein [Sphingobium scionense]